VVVEGLRLSFVLFNRVDDWSLQVVNICFLQLALNDSRNGLRRRRFIPGRSSLLGFSKSSVDFEVATLTDWEKALCNPRSELVLALEEVEKTVLKPNLALTPDSLSAIV